MTNINIVRGARTLVAAALLAALFAPVTAPASSGSLTTTVRIPKTLARSVQHAPRALPLEFSATHVVFSWNGPVRSAIEYRETDATGTTSNWIAPGVDERTRKTGRAETGVLSLGDATAVEWRPASGAPVRNMRITYLNTVDGPTTTRVVPAPRMAAPGAPAIVTRAEWGADESISPRSGSCKRTFAPVQQLFVHHTAGSNSDEQDSAATMRAIYWYHVKSNGWCDIGYNFVVGRDGLLYEGRWARSYASGETHTGEDEAGRAVVGAHVAGYNTGSIGVSLMGNFELEELPNRMRSTLVDFLAWKAQRHGLDPEGRHTYVNGDTKRDLFYIAGHRDAGSTACPGKNVYNILPDIRRETRERMTPRASTLLQLNARPAKIGYGSSSRLTGKLRDANGVPLAGKEISLSRRGADSWRVKRRVTTGADGTFDVSVKPDATVSFRAEFDGDEAFRSATSSSETVTVRHVVAAFVEGGVLLDNGDTRFPPGTRSVALYGWARPSHAARIKIRLFRAAGDGAMRRVGTYGTPLERGEWRYAAGVPSPGRYKAVARFAGDDRHALGKSDPVFFRIRKG
ncbi:MAG TPA: N-acetylmuramoyl-L-alanine amidase [Actinomycetota bacterium]|jgi:5-hydroxyisourate hydrolase-like protein (transthyretin family)|nr:N-acetylmuramoyl-L-alanine amidase [Actinomycetota bacterium]